MAIENTEDVDIGVTLDTCFDTETILIIFIRGVRVIPTSCKRGTLQLEIVRRDRNNFGKLICCGVFRLFRFIFLPPSDKDDGNLQQTQPMTLSLWRKPNQTVHAHHMFVKSFKRNRETMTPKMGTKETLEATNPFKV